MRAVRLHRTGGPEVLVLEEVAAAPPGPGEIQVRQAAIGLNFIDTYHRSGLYPIPLPSGLGTEGAGTVGAVGDGVTGFQVGDRVAYATGPLGAYAETYTLPASQAVKVPDGVELATAAAALLKGMTAEFLLRRCFPVQAGQTILVHAAAGGVGSILVQWAKRLGATVIATAGSAAKAERASALGADHAILYRDIDVASEVRRVTDGAGVAVAYDAVGADTFEGTLGSLAPRGTFVSFGNASGPVPPIDPLALMRAGSIAFVRPTLFHYVATPAELAASAAALFDAMASGAVQVEVGQSFALTEARAAHAAMESRATVGASLLIP